ncbi:hypothetical protein ACWFR5_21370 [Streptomyces sp. NPDC055092]
MTILPRRAIDAMTAVTSSDAIIGTHKAIAGQGDLSGVFASSPKGRQRRRVVWVLTVCWAQSALESTAASCTAEP